MGDVGRDTEKVESFTPPSRPVPHPLVLNLNITGWPTLAKTLPYTTKLLDSCFDRGHTTGWNTRTPGISQIYIPAAESPTGAVSHNIGTEGGAEFQRAVRGLSRHG